MGNLKKTILSKINPISIIQHSSLFNSKYYKEKYGINEVEGARHYYEQGWKLGYNPSALFNTKDYLKANPDINDICPLLHYELYGIQENRQVRIEALKKIEDSNIVNTGNLKDVYFDQNAVLIVDLDLKKDSKSGSCSYASVKKKEYEEKGFKVLFLKYKMYSSDYSLYFEDFSLRLNQLDELTILFNKVSVKTIFINNLAFNIEVEKFIDMIISLKKKFNFELIYAFNDHLSVCPSFFLLNNDCVPCSIIDEKQCNQCLQNNKYVTLVRQDIVSWRNKFKELFKEVNQFIFFSNYTKTKIEQFYNLHNSDIIDYHQPLITNLDYSYQKNNSPVIKIGFVGNYCKEKGSFFFDEVIKKLRETYKVEGIIIGYSNEECDYLTTGKYDVNDLGKLIRENEVDFVLYPSVANETFSYVVQELMLLNVPIVSFTCGGHAERLESYPYKEFTKEVSVDSIYEATLHMIQKVGKDEIRL